LVAFGTDGVRGRAYEELTLADASRIGAAVAQVLGPAAIAVGRDTRASGPDYLSALAAGVAVHGGRIADLGVVPTPAVARYCAVHDVPGIVISASHNPFHDNGLKVFARGGLKLDDPTEAKLEAAIATQLAPGAAAPIDDVNSVAVSEYLTHIEASIGVVDLSAMSVVVDAANGAASALVAPLFERLGVRLSVIHASPDGRNINASCGSTDPTDLINAVRSSRAHCGIALDGDADRVVAVDGSGGIVDGDQVIAICALDRHARGALAGETVVVTVMTNLGFRRSMGEHGIAVHETPVGDRHVLAALEANGWNLGGEQSGHVIFRDLATTGDGLLTAVQLLATVARSSDTLADLAEAAMIRLPQVLENITVAGDAAAVVADLQPRLRELAAELGDSGRVLVRPSGTEPLIRVMVEASSDAAARDLAARIVSWI
jgi:phosphoglucosamine mutase